MSNFKDIRRVNGGIDSDNDIRDIAEGDFLLESLNLSAGISIRGTLLNLKGNTKVSYTLPSGDSTCIGAIRDIQRNAVIYFLYNSNGNHCILHYFCATNTIEAILAPEATIPFTTDFLNFQKLSKIHSANIINDILLWTDNFNPPRKINIKRAKDFLLQLTPSAVNTPYNNLIATGSLEQKLEFIDAIKRPSLRQPTTELGFDGTRATNFILNKMIQVRYRYIYDDNEKSVWFTGSAVTLPTGQENAFGPFSVPSANNYVDVFYDSGHPTVASIDIAFRFDNIGIWQKLDEPIKKYDNDNQQILPNDTLLIYRFFNDRVLVPLNDNESLKNYDSVPLLAKTQELIDSNRLVYANNLENYTNPDIDVSLSYVNIAEDVGDGTIHQNTHGITITTFSIAFFSTPPITPYAGVVIDFIGNTTSGTINIKYQVTTEDMVNYPFSLCNNMFDYLLRNYSGISGFSFTKFADSINFGVGGLVSGVVYAPINKYTGFKRGAFHKFGIVYYDYAGRDGGVITGDELSIYNPYLPEILPNYTPNDPTVAYHNYFVAQINSRPPEWAHSYSIVYSTNNLRKYTQFIIKGNVTIGASTTTIDCSYIVDYISELKQGSVDFQFEVGDRLRFIQNSDWYCPQYVETEVLGYDATLKKLTVRNFSYEGVTSNMTSPTTDETLCELFAYKAETDSIIYYEFAQTYPIIDAGLSTRSHSANLQNQNASLTIPAKVKLSRGDAYFYKRYFTAGLVTNVESENFSDYYQSQNIDISRIQVVTDSEQKRYGQAIRYGGRFFPNTNVNNLLSFDGDAYDTLDTRYGDINKVCTVGFVLKALQTKKMTSIYINRNMLFNADGTDQLIQTDQVLSNKQVSETDFGCVNPESVCTDDRQMFFFDLNTGSFVQDSANGPYPISNYKFITAMKNKARLINSSQDNIFVYCNVDNLLSTVNVSFVNESDPESEINDTYIYNTNDNRWKPRQSYLPEYVCSNALVFVSFKNGELYTHNTNDVRNNFYGVQYNSVISIVSNVEPSRVKVFDSIWERSTKLFSAPTIGDITLPATGNYNQMQSRLLPNVFVVKEGQYYAYFLKNALTANKPSVAMALQNGDKLRGQALKAILTNDDTTELTLYEIIINSTLSDIS